MNKKFYPAILIVAVLLTVTIVAPILHRPNKSTQNEEVYAGKVERVIREKPLAFDNVKSTVQTLEVRIKSKPKEGQKIEVTSEAIPDSLGKKVKKGDNIIIGLQGGSSQSYYFIDYDRSTPLLLLLLLFVILTVIVVGKKGVRSLLSLSCSFIGIFIVVIPLISNGFNPLIVSLSSLIVLVPTIFFFTHGFSKKTIASIAGVIFSFLVTFLIVYIFVEAASFTGLFIDDLHILILTSSTGINVNAIIISGVIIGILGALDDVAITQASIVEQLSRNYKGNRADMFKRAMEIGKDHLASIVNTLILVYVGASLPLLLLFYRFERSPLVYIVSEPVAIAVITALSVAIGLIIAVPITTYVAVHMFVAQRMK